MKQSAPLGHVVIGPHSQFTTWVFGIVNDFALNSGGRGVRHTDRKDRIELYPSANAVILTHYPSSDLVNLIECEDVHVIYVFEDPLDVTTYLRKSTGVSLLESIRAQTASGIANRAIGASDRVDYLHRTTDRAVSDIVASIARFLDFVVPASVLKEIAEAASFGAGAAANLESALASRGERYAPPLRESHHSTITPSLMIATDVLDPLVALARGNSFRPIVWPTPVFQFYDAPGRAAPRVADVSGPTRNLYYGPYFYLPPGYYRAEVILGFSNEIRDVPFSLELHTSYCLARARIDKRRSGEFRGYFHFRHVESTETVELRLRNEATLSQGRLSLIELAFFCEIDVPRNPSDNNERE